MVSPSDLLTLFRAWLAEQQGCWQYDPESPDANPLAMFWADHGYPEAVYLEKARMVYLTACQKFFLQSWLYDAISAEPRTFGALATRLNAKELLNDPPQSEVRQPRMPDRAECVLRPRTCSVAPRR